MALLAGNRVIPCDLPCIEECHTPAVQRVETRHIANLVRARLGVEVADDDWRKAVFGSPFPRLFCDEYDLLLSKVAMIELPMQMGTAESNRAMGAVHSDTEYGSALPITPIGKPNFLRLHDRPATRNRISESDLSAIRKRHRWTVFGVIADFADELTNLVDDLAHEHFLEPDQIGLEALDPLPN